MRVLITVLTTLLICSTSNAQSAPKDGDASASAIPAAEKIPPSSSEPAAIEARASEPTSDRWNVALGIGLGQQYGGFLGANLAAYHRVASSSISVAAFASVGLLDVENCCEDDVGWSAGGLVTWGWSSRLALAVSYGAVRQERQTNGYGVTTAVGYELMTDMGFWLRWLAGATIPTDELITKDLIPSINVGFGWKI